MRRAVPRQRSEGPSPPRGCARATTTRLAAAALLALLCPSPLRVAAYRTETVRLPQQFNSAGSPPGVVSLLLPADLRPGERLPLVVVLAGYCLTGRIQDQMQLNYSGLVDERRIALINLAAPYKVAECALCNTTIRASNKARMPIVAAGGMTTDALTRAGQCTAWDATDACCQPTKRGANGGDGPYVLAAVRSALADRPELDPSRVYLVGIASAGFLALRLACDSPGTFAAIAAYAAASWTDFSRCGAPPSPQQPPPPPLLIAHGTNDTVVPPYADTNSFGVSFPSFDTTVRNYVARYGDGQQPTSRERITLPGRYSENGHEILVDTERFTGGRAEVQKWTVLEGQHFIPQQASYSLFSHILDDFLLPHRLSKDSASGTGSS